MTFNEEKSISSSALDQYLNQGSSIFPLFKRKNPSSMNLRYGGKVDVSRLSCSRAQPLKGPQGFMRRSVNPSSDEIHPYEELFDIQAASEKKKSIDFTVRES
jgi:hypothetical protein